MLISEYNGTHGCRGSKNINAKLTEDAVRQIRHLVVAARKDKRDVAEQFGISVWTLKDIVRRRTWRHVE